MKRALWSPSRVKSALQCGRKLQGSEEGWPRVDHINGVRGGIAHTAIETWESLDRHIPIHNLVVDAWEQKLEHQAGDALDEAGLTADGLCADLSNLWGVEASIRADEDVVAERLAGEYKRPRQTKKFETETVFLANARHTAKQNRVKLTYHVDSVDWPWQHEKSVMVQGFDHSLETARSGAEYLTQLYPEPDIIGAEWDLEATLDNGYRVHGYIDRVEATADGVVVADYKSSKYQDTELDNWLQVATYAVIAEDHLGFPPVEVWLIYLRDQATDRFQFSPGWRKSLESLVAAADDVLEREAFAPTFSGCGICPYIEVCRQQFQLIPASPSIKEEVA